MFNVEDDLTELFVFLPRIKNLAPPVNRSDSTAWAEVVIGQFPDNVATHDVRFSPGEGSRHVRSKRAEAFTYADIILCGEGRAWRA